MYTDTTSKERKKVCDLRKLTIFFCEIDDCVPDDKVLFIRMIRLGFRLIASASHSRLPNAKAIICEQNHFDYFRYVRWPYDRCEQGD